jgi:poly-gamma-glutamate synthesis protein (capsule biosynthesis protein)
VAHRCLAAGADVFLSHGAPVLQGLELINGKLAAYGLGNFVFHSSNQKVRAFPDVWRSALLTLTFDGRQLASIEAHPVSLGDAARHDDPAGNRDAPRLWSGIAARNYLEDWLSRGFISRERWSVSDEKAFLKLP